MKHLLNRVSGWDAMGSLPTGWCHPQGGRRCSGNMGPSGESVDMRAARCRQAQRERAQWFQSEWTWPGKPRGAGLGGILTAGGEAGKTWGGTEGRQLGWMGQWVGGVKGDWRSCLTPERVLHPRLSERKFASGDGELPLPLPQPTPLPAAPPRLSFSPLCPHPHPGRHQPSSSHPDTPRDPAPGLTPVSSALGPPIL